MLKALRSLFKKSDGQEQQQDDTMKVCDEAPSQVLELEGAFLPFGEMLDIAPSYVDLDWVQLWHWLDEHVASDHQDEVWRSAQKNWLLHLREAMSSDEHQYNLVEDEGSFLLSALEPHLVKATLGFLNRSKKRVLDVLGDVASSEQASKDTLIVCVNADDYYNYIAHFYDTELEIAPSGGVFLNRGCPHFLTTQSDLSLMENTIVHELTHNYLAHLALPLWLDEGVAVNVEQRLASHFYREFTPQELFAMHQAYWNAQTIQGFWSGESFQRTESMMLSYDLAARMVSILAKDWGQFRQFLLDASCEDMGNRAANSYIGCLGCFVGGLLGKDNAQDWAPTSLC